MLLSFVQASSGSSSVNKKILMIVIDRVSFEDFEGYSAIADIARNGSIALMNNRPSGSYSACKSYVGIGSGNRAEGTPSAVTAVQVDEDIREVFFGRTGIRVSDGMVVNPDINRLIVQNEKGEYGAVAGNIGEALRSSGYKTAVIGNGDLDKSEIRWAVSIAMDRKGRVDYGRVDDGILEKDKTFPTGQRTDYASIESYLDAIESKADFIVIETGDLTRIEESRDLLSADMYSYHRSTALGRIDAFLSEIRERADKNGWLLMIVTPYPSNSSIARGDRLTPLIVYGEGYPGGFLVSATTRREGIVGNVDIAATVLRYMNVSGEGVVGRPLKGVDMPNNIDRIKELNTRVVNTSNYRYPVLRDYAIIVIGIIILGLITVLYPGILGGKLKEFEKAMIIAVMFFPAVLLVLPLLNLNTLASTGISIIVIVLTLAILVYAAPTGTNKKILIVSSVTSAAVLLDIVFGGHLIKNSLLGYDPIIGARYYGIGNEYMGVVTGSALVAVSSYLEDRKLNLCFAAMFLSLVLLIVGYPGLGANVGGAITCFCAFSFYLIRVRGKRIGIKQALFVFLGLLVLVAVFIIADMVFLENHSHLALAIQDSLNGGPAHIIGIINRKLAMNIKLLRYTIWTKVLVAVIAATGILFYRPVGIFKKVFSRYPYLTKAWSSIVVAAAVGMAVNDSGVVTSATSSIFFMMSMLYVFIEERGEKGGAKEASQNLNGL
ncbi:MAG: hypothetical protein QME73_03585 [Bacillota bacterium]|nr:hypothetical protein [Bacillota bacterium]